MPRILGIDHGTVRVGLALSDELELVANPLMTLQNGPQLIEEIARLIRAKHVTKVVIGAPITMGGQRGTALLRVEKFADQLGKALRHDVPIELVDERLSSVTAERALKRDGHEINPQEGLVDQVAATVILQDYLNQQRGPEGYLLPDESFDMPWLDEPGGKNRRRK